MSDDLVKRLQSKNTSHVDADIWMGEAADEITRLRAKVERLQRSLATIALLSDCSSSAREARAALGDDT